MLGWVGVPMIVLGAGLVVARLHARDWRVTLDEQAQIQQIALVALSVAGIARLAQPTLEPAGAALVAAGGGLAGATAGWILARVVARRTALSPDEVRSVGWTAIAALAVIVAAIPSPRTYLLGARGGLGVVAMLMLTHNARFEADVDGQPQGSLPGDHQCKTTNTEPTNSDD